jgi:AbrB family looped-hinge helix DNA binding protein
MADLFHSRLTENGRILIPAECRRLLGLQPNAQLVLRVDSDGLHIKPLVEQLRSFRQRIRKSHRSGRTLMDDLHDIRSSDVD